MGPLKPFENCIFKALEVNFCGPLKLLEFLVYEEVLLTDYLESAGVGKLMLFDNHQIAVENCKEISYKVESH